MDEVGTIRRLVLAEGWTIRRVARELRVARNTVRRYLAGAEPGVRKAAVRARPVLAAVQARIDALLAEAPRWTQGKQRLTATRLHGRAPASPGPPPGRACGHTLPLRRAGR